MASNVQEKAQIVHELAFEYKKLELKAKKQHGSIPDIPDKEREFVQDELVYIAEHLMKTCGLTIQQSRQLIAEILTVSV
jgi:hypothetical protein